MKYMFADSGQPTDWKVNWALSLKPGDKVLSNWEELDEDFEELDEEGFPKNLNQWREVTVVAVRKSELSQSKVVVQIQEFPDHEAFDIAWIEPIAKL